MIHIHILKLNKIKYLGKLGKHIKQKFFPWNIIAITNLRLSVEVLDYILTSTSITGDLFKINVNVIIWVVTIISLLLVLNAT